MCLLGKEGSAGKVLGLGQMEEILPRPALISTSAALFCDSYHSTTEEIMLACFNQTNFEGVIENAIQRGSGMMWDSTLTMSNVSLNFIKNASRYVAIVT